MPEFLLLWYSSIHPKMKKILLIIAPIILAVIVFLAIISLFTKDKGKGALQVTAQPKAQVFLDGKAIGQTPLCKCEGVDMILAGEHTIRLVPADTSLPIFEEKITITRSVLTVVDRTFGKGLTSEGSIITLTPLADKKATEILVLSFPQGTSVLLDNNAIGKTPLLQKNLTESDHELKIAKDGYKEKIIRIRTAKGYKLETLIYLGLDLLTTPTTSLTPTSQASPSAALSFISILQTPTGFLRVRESGTLDAAEIARVYPGETYEFITEQNGWYAIKLKDGRTGWITTQYAKKQ